MSAGKAANCPYTNGVAGVKQPLAENIDLHTK